MSPVNATLPPFQHQATERSFIALYFVLSLCLFASVISFLSIVATMYQERARIGATTWLAFKGDDVLQVRLLLLLIIVVNLSYQIDNAIIYMTPLDLMTPDLCNSASIASNMLYAIFYNSVFLFFLKKTFIAGRVTSSPGLLYRVCRVLAVAGPMVAMPIFIGLSWGGFGAILFDICLDAPTLISLQYVLSIEVVFFFVYVYGEYPIHVAH